MGNVNLCHGVDDMPVGRYGQGFASTVKPLEENDTDCEISLTKSPYNRNMNLILQQTLTATAKSHRAKFQAGSDGVSRGLLKFHGNSTHAH